MSQIFLKGRKDYAKRGRLNGRKQIRKLKFEIPLK
jgi:hypothetical protein